MTWLLQGSSWAKVFGGALHTGRWNWMGWGVIASKLYCKCSLSSLYISAPFLLVAYPANDDIQRHHLHYCGWHPHLCKHYCRVNLASGQSFFSDTRSRANGRYPRTCPHVQMGFLPNGAAIKFSAIHCILETSTHPGIVDGWNGASCNGRSSLMLQRYMYTYWITSRRIIIGKGYLWSAARLWLIDHLWSQSAKNNRQLSGVWVWNRLGEVSFLFVMRSRITVSSITSRTHSKRYNTDVRTTMRTMFLRGQFYFFTD